MAYEDTLRSIAIRPSRAGFKIEREVSWFTVFRRVVFYGTCLLLGVLTWAAVFYGCTRTAHAQSGSCELVKDSDQRHYCRACSGKPGECEFISKPDLRLQCRALCKKPAK